MNILHRVTKNGEAIGFMIDDDGMQYEVLDKAIYTELILPALAQSGYKILDYNCNIINPNGINIQDLSRKETTASEDDMQMMLDEAERCLTEPECVKYFTHDTRAEEYKFLEPTNPEIKTREELVAYLNKCFMEYASIGICYDTRPLNSFVAREALFDITELQNDAEVKRLFRCIAVRRNIGNFGLYKRCVQYLNEKGVLNGNYEPTPTEFINAYTAWGVDGIKTPCYKRELRLNVDGEIHAINEAATLQTVHANRMLELGLQDRSGVLYCMDEKVEGYDIIQWGRETITPSSQDIYNDNIVKSRMWDKDYKALNVLLTPKRDRLYFDFVDDNGFPYTVKIQHDRMCFMNKYSTFYDTPYIILRGLDGRYMTLDEGNTEQAYYITNMSISKAYDLIGSVTKKVPVKSSYDLCRKEGLNPEAAIKYMARRIKENNYSCVTTSEYNGIDFWRAPDIYRTGPTQQLIEKYNPQNEPYENIDELIDIMLDTQSAMINDGTYAANLTSELKAVKDRASQLAYDDTQQELRLKPLESLSFVKACFNDEVNIEFLGDGLMADMGDEVRKLAHLILTTCKVVLGANATAQQITSYIQQFEDVAPFDVSAVIKQRDNAYIGYLKDRAVLNGRRGAESNYIFYVTKIFREMANVPAYQQRHYAVEVFALDVREKYNKQNRSTQKSLADAVIAASQVSNFNRTQKWIIEKQAWDIASKIFMGLIFNSVDVKADGTDYRVETNFGDGQSLSVRVPAGVYNYIKRTDWRGCFRYISLCDYCNNEISMNTKFGFYCLNANIDPWRVTPKDGYSIPEYNFFVNYCEMAWMDGFSDEFKMGIAREKAKPVTLNPMQLSYNIVSYSDLDVDNDKAAHDESTIDHVLDEIYGETFNLYRKRFQIHNSAAMKRGEYLVRMRLKSDVRFGNYADKCGMSLMESDEYAPLEDNRKVASQFVNTYDVRVIENKDTMRKISTDKCIIKQFSIDDYSYLDAMRWFPIMSGTFTTKGVVYVFNGYLLLIDLSGNVKKISVADIDKETGRSLCDVSMAYQLSATQFYISAVNGDFVLEVK